MSLHRSFAKHRVTTLLIGRLEALDYRPPQPPQRGDGTENPTYRLVVDEFIDQFAGFEEASLQAGMTEWIGQWRYKRWPTVGELRPFMIEAQRALRPALEKPKPAQPWRERERGEADYRRMKEASIEAMRIRDAEDRANGIEPLGGGGKLPHECSTAEKAAYMARLPKGIPDEVRDAVLAV